MRIIIRSIADATARNGDWFMSTKRLERLAAVRQRTGLCTSSIYEGMKDGWFPKNFAISKQARAWDSEEIDAWIAARIAARDSSAWN
jgi:prophage regulatory protein